MPETMPTAAFIISLIAGIFILLGSVYMTMWGIGAISVGFTGMRGMMGGAGGIMGQPYYGAMVGTWILGLASGLIVLISAIMLNSRPAQATTWGTLILVFSILSVFGGFMGGFLIGAVLGIVGGALALSTPKS
jgi:hypothetical protein